MLVESSYNDLTLCQITSQDVKDSFAISLMADEFSQGSLPKPSNVRPNKLFTADSAIVLYKIGSLNRQKLGEIVEKIVEILKS